MSQKTWGERFDDALANPPDVGTVLVAQEGQLARLDVETNPGSAPFVYGRAFVSNIVHEGDVGWNLQPFNSDQTFGWKCILLPNAREDALKRLGARHKILAVKSLRVIRHSHTKKSLLCEVAEYATDEQVTLARSEAESQQETAELALAV